jgi:zinc transporter, ZIP family
MSDGQIILLGAIAGLTIFLGLPVGRMRNLSSETKAFFNAIATGVLIFLLVETLSKSLDPVDVALEHVTVASGGTWAEFVGKAALFLLCFGFGLMSLVYYDKWMSQRGRREITSVGPGAASAQEFRLSGRIHQLSDARRLALFIAIGIGLHNFSEGLAIGQSAASGAVDLALLLIIGFGLHNATEGFGIVAPMAGEEEIPSWGFLITLGVIGGGPTFFGTLIGQAWVSEWLDMAFLALAAGSILYVVVQLLYVSFKMGHKEMLMWGLFVGLILGFGTDFVLVAAGA